MTTILRLVSERSGNDVGWISLDGDAVDFSDADARKVFESYRRIGGWTDSEAFEALSMGWSNGYVTIPAKA